MLQKIITILFISGNPISIASIAKILNVNEEEVVNNLIEIKDYLNKGGLDLLKNDKDISIVTMAENAEIIETFWKEEINKDLTQASLQVLTLVAYLRNPTRADISFIRGVQSSQSIRILSVRGLITREGEKCIITGEALKYLGVVKVEDLPDFENINKELIEKLKLASSIE